MASYLVSEEKLDENGNPTGIFEKIENTSNSWGVTVQGSNIEASFSLDGVNFVNNVNLCVDITLEYLEADVEYVKMVSNQPFWYRIIY
ncbi:MAG: hypothetical protein ACRCZ2_14045 [Fusobacteriaceae bacterium]